MSHIKKPASFTAKTKKILLPRGHDLIPVLKPDYITVLEPGAFNINTISDQDVSDDPSLYNAETTLEEENLGLKAPSLSDITLLSKKIVTDSNKNQYVEFTFNIKNSSGDTVVGVNAYGQ